MTVKEQIEKLGILVNDYASHVDALDTSFEETKEFASWSVVLNLIKIEFVYTKTERADCPVSTLFCRIYLHKNSSLSYHIPEIIDYLNIDDFHCYYFPYIENEERLTACFDYLCQFLNMHIKDIELLGNECDKWDDKKLEIIKRTNKIKESDIPTNKDEREAYFSFLFALEDWLYIARFTNFPAYRFFLNGQYEKSIKKYAKVNGLFPYEEKLISFMKSTEPTFKAISPECNTRKAVKNYNASKKDLFGMIISWIICIIVLAIPFSLAIIIVNAVYEAKTVYADTISVWNAFLFSGVPGVLFGIMFKNKISGFFNKQSKEAKDFEDILIPKSTMTAIKIFGSVILCAIIFLFAITVKPVFLVYDSTISYSSTKDTNTYEISEIEKIYHINGRYNSDGEYIARGSFVLVFKDGTQIDTDTFVNSNEKHIEKHLLPLFDQDIICVESEKEIV